MKEREGAGRKGRSIFFVFGNQEVRGDKRTGR